jgi:hypothetical protein
MEAISNRAHAKKAEEELNREIRRRALEELSAESCTTWK